MVVQLGSLREQYTNTFISVSEGTGGNLPNSLTGFLFVSGKNRTGRNLLSDAVAYSTTAASAKIVIDLTTDLRKDGEDLFEIIISQNTVNNPQTAQQLAKWKAKDADQETLRALPATIEIIDQDSFTYTFADSASLPITPLNGALVFITADGKYYVYDSEALSGTYPSGGGFWVETTFNGLTYLASTTSVGGCDVNVGSVPNNFTIITPPKTGSTPSTKVNYWLLNGLQEGSGTILDSSYGLTLQVLVDGIDQSAKLSEKIKINFRGYVRRSTGEFQAGPTPSTFDWTFGIPFFLPQDLLRGYAASYDIWLDFDENEVASYLTENKTIRILPIRFNQVGQKSPLSFLLGNSVLADGNRLRVLPGIRLEGIAVYNGFDTSNATSSTTLPFSGYTANTAGQIVAIDAAAGNNVIIRQSAGELLGNEFIRAVVSTEAGESDVSPISNAVVLTGSQTLSIDVTHPVSATLWTIRSNYPDVIAGNTNAITPPPEMKAYVLVDSTTLYEYNLTFTVVSSSTQNITINDLSGATVIGSLPTIDADYSVYAMDTAPAVSALGGGALTAGTYEVYVAYNYPVTNTVPSKISHSPGVGALPELESTLIDAINNANNLTNVLLTAQYTQPALNATVQVNVTNQGLMFEQGYTQNATGGLYLIESFVDPPTNIVWTIRNIAASNAPPGTIIPINERMNLSGPQGEQGPQGQDGSGFTPLAFHQHSMMYG